MIWIATKNKSFSKSTSLVCCETRHISSGSCFSVPFPVSIFINNMEAENTYKICEWHHTGRSWNYFGKQDETHEWFQNLEIWHETKKVELETNQEESHFGRRNPTQSWNTWLSSKPNNRLEFQLGKTLKKDSTLWLRTAWDSHLRGIHQDFLHRL